MALYGNNKFEFKKDGNVYENRTFKFVLPLLKIYGQSIINIYNQMRKVAVGINDFTAMQLGVDYDKHIFILVDIENTEAYLESSFDGFLETIRQHPAYEYDYCYDFKLKLHMVIIKLPDRFVKALQHFKESRYSKMFNKADLDFFFSTKRGEVHKPILTKEHSYKKIFEEKIKENFVLQEAPQEEWYEYDFPLELKEEIFNYRGV